MCRCSNRNVHADFKFCPYCGDKFNKQDKRYPIANIFDLEAYSYAINTGIKRPPKKGEYFLSGAVPAAYPAPNDLSIPYYIAEIVEPC